MVGPDALFDTNILIDDLCGLPQAKSEIARYTTQSISIISWMEVMAGTDDSDEAVTRAYLNSFRVVPISTSIAEAAASLRRTLRLKLPDAIILATARVEQCTLVSRNSRDYDEKDIGIRIPYSLKL